MNKTCLGNINLANAIWIRKYEYCKQLFDKQFKHMNNCDNNKYNLNDNDNDNDSLYNDGLNRKKC